MKKKNLVKENLLLKLFSAIFCLTAAFTFAACEDNDDDIKDLRSQISEQSSVIATLESKLATLNGDLSQAKADLATAQSKLNAAIEAAKQDAAKEDEAVLAAAKAAVAEAKAEAIEESAKQVAALKETIESEIAAMASKTQLEAAIKEVEEAHKADIDRIESDLKKLETQVSANAKAIEKLQELTVQLGKADEQMQTEIEAIKVTLAEITETLSKAATKEELNNAISKLDSKLTGLIDSLTDRVAANEGNISSLQENVANITSDLANLSSRLDSLVLAVEDINSTISGLQTTISTGLSKLRGELSSAMNTLASMRPTTLVFKPMNYRNGIAAVVFEPVIYTAYHNDDNTATTATGALNSYDFLDFPRTGITTGAYDSYWEKRLQGTACPWVVATTHYVKMPAEVRYAVNPSGVRTEAFKMNGADFYGHYAATRNANDDINGVLSVNYNSHFTGNEKSPAHYVEGNTLVFRINEKGAYVDKNIKDFYNKGTWGWKYADNVDNYIGRVDEATVWGENIKDMENGVSNVHGYGYIFVAEIPLADTVKVDGENNPYVTTDYAMAVEEPMTAKYVLVSKGDASNSYNPNKKDIYKVVAEAVDQHKLVNKGTTSNVIYDLYPSSDSNAGFEPNDSYSLADYIDVLEIGTDKAGAARKDIVSPMRMEDLGFQLRFYVPTYDGVNKVDPQHDGSTLPKYKGPHFGPYEYYFGSSTIDFQKYLDVDAKTGNITIREWASKSKGFTPIVLAQVVDTRRPNTPVVTEAYFRVVIKGDDTKTTIEVTDYPKETAKNIYKLSNNTTVCGQDSVILTCSKQWLKTNVYDKYNTTWRKFNAYFEPKLSGTGNTSWAGSANWHWVKTGTGVNDYDIVVSIPYEKLKGLSDKQLTDFTTVLHGNLGGNNVDITFTAHVGLPKITLSYKPGNWVDYGTNTRVVGTTKEGINKNFNTSTYELDLQSLFTTTATGSLNTNKFKQDANTSIYYMAEFNNNVVTDSVVNAYKLEIDPVEFVNGNSTGSRKSYWTSGYEKKTYFDLQAEVYTGGLVANYNVGTNNSYLRYVGTSNESFAMATPYKITLTEDATNLHGTAEAIQMLYDKASVPVQITCEYNILTSGNAERIRSIKEFAIEYQQPITATRNAAADAYFKGMSSTEQSVNVKDLYTLIDLLGNVVTPKEIGDPDPLSLNHIAWCQAGDPNFADYLSQFYCVQDPVFDILNCKTNLELQSDGTYVVSNEGNYCQGPLPDGVSVKLENDADGKAKLVYYNNGAVLQQDYKIYVNAVIKHKWGEIRLNTYEKHNPNGKNIPTEESVIINVSK